MSLRQILVNCPLTPIILLTIWLLSSTQYGAICHPSTTGISEIPRSNASQDETTANDEEASPSEDSAAAASHFIDRHLFHLFSNDPPSPKSINLSVELNNSSLVYLQSPLQRNCSYVFNDVFCDCDLLVRRFSCYNIQSVNDIRSAFDHLLNATRLIYWTQLEVHCIEPYVNDEPSDSKQDTQLNQSFHISHEMFTEGPRFESVVLVGDCSKPKHYDNLIAIDRDVQQIVMLKNMLRMATSCSLLQPKFEQLRELVLRDCLMAGDMISSTFSTRCLGQYGNRNEPMPLTKLIISSCNISLIESGAFYNFAELEQIDLSNNQISHLSRQTFAPHLYRLRTLKLNNNRLNSLDAEFFEKLPELREVILSSNRLTTLPSLPSAGPGVAQVLHLAYNPWDCRCRLTWILEEPIDSVRFIADEPICMTPANIKNITLFKGLQMIQDTFC